MLENNLTLNDKGVSSPYFKREFMPEINQKCYQTQNLKIGKVIKITKTNIYFDVGLKAFVKTKKKKFINTFFKLYKNLNNHLEKNELTLTHFFEEIKIGKSFKFILYKVNSNDGNCYIDYDKTTEYLMDNRLFYEVESIKKSDGLVKGYILNNVHGGFSVGVSGLVAFVPNNELTLNQQINTQYIVRNNYLMSNTILDFKISNINFNRRNIVLTRPKKFN